MAKIEVTPETLADLIKSAVDAALANAKLDRMDAAKAGKADEQVTRDAALATAFKKAKYTDIVLLDRTKSLAEQGSDVTILTFNKWMELGRRVKEGEHAIKIKGLNLRYYHKSQTRIATVEERKANFAKMQEAIRKHNDAKNGKSEAASA